MLKKTSRTDIHAVQLKIFWLQEGVTILCFGEKSFAYSKAVGSILHFQDSNMWRILFVDGLIFPDVKWNQSHQPLHCNSLPGL